MKRRKKKSNLKKLKDRLWELCKQITRLKYGNVCYTCGARRLSGSNWQTGHFIASSVCGAYLRYDLRNLRIQCMRCNIHAGGNGAIYYEKMVEREGQKYVDKLFKDKQKIIKADALWFQSKIDEYTSILNSLEKTQSSF
jgi:5-methylcytosine-specific restriction endonuclease McrA